MQFKIRQFFIFSRNYREKFFIENRIPENSCKKLFFLFSNNNREINERIIGETWNGIEVTCYNQLIPSSPSEPSFLGRTTFLFSGPRLRGLRGDLGCWMARTIERTSGKRWWGEERGKKKKKRVPFRRSVRLYHLFTSFYARDHSRTHVYLHNAYTRNFQDRGYDRVIISTYTKYPDD